MGDRGYNRSTSHRPRGHSGTNYIGEHVDTVRIFPTKMVLEDEVKILEKPCTRLEILEVLKGFVL
jgi:hypothetical protein